jgi:hypothetical protein
MIASHLKALKWLQNQYPYEQHSVGGDCINPKCDYKFTSDDADDITNADGWFTCPQCDRSYNYMEENRFGHVTRAGLTPDEMGNIGEELVKQMGEVPGLGPVSWVSPTHEFPIDAVIGPYGVEIKALHSEAMPRIKMGGQKERQDKIDYVQQNGLLPAIIGVRLNFYQDLADIFVRKGTFTDTWLGNDNLEHVATLNFSHLNPFKHPEDVPSATDMPTDDESDIPF